MPIRQDLLLGNTVELTYDLGDPVWEIRGSQDGAQSHYVYPRQSNAVPLELQLRGFESRFQSTSSISTLSVPGSVENNQTVISCKLIEMPGDDYISYILNVVGNERIMNVCRA